MAEIIPKKSNKKIENQILAALMTNKLSLEELAEHLNLSLEEVEAELAHLTIPISNRYYVYKIQGTEQFTLTPEGIKHFCMDFYWKFWYEQMTNKKLMTNFENYITSYLEVTEGKIIDIGCGQSTYILDLLNSNYELHAVDSNPLQLSLLKKRIKSTGHKIDRVNFHETSFDFDKFKNKKFAGVIIQNLLHLYSYKWAQEFVSKIKKLITKGSIVIVQVHGDLHHYNTKKRNANQFKYFYKEEDLEELFPETDFELLHYSSTKFIENIATKSFNDEYVKQFSHKIGITDPQEIAGEQKRYNNEELCHKLLLVVRKK